MEQLPERLLKFVSTSVVVSDPTLPDNPLVYVNPAFEEATGYFFEEAVGHNCRFLQGPDTEQHVLAGLREALKAGEYWNGTLRNYRKNGEAFWNELSISPVFDEWSRLTRFIGVQRDVGERVEIEKSQREKEERLRAVLVQYGSDIITILDSKGNVSYVSPAVELALGRTPENRIGKSGLELVHPDDAERVAWELSKVIDEGGTNTMVQYRLQHADGTWRHFEGIATNLLENSGVEGVVVSSRDVTERVKTQKRLTQLMEQAADAIIVHDLAGNLTDVNRRTCEILGYSRAELLTMRVPDIEIDHSYDDIQGSVRGLDDGTYVTLNGRHRRKDGTTFPVEVRTGVFTIGERRLFLAICRDVTERKEYEQALMESEEQFRSAFEDTSTGAALIGLDHRYLKVNNALCEMLGYSKKELVGKSFNELTHSNDAGTSEQRLSQIPGLATDSESLEKRCIRKDGSVLWVLADVSLVRNVDGEPSHFISQFQDITERKLAEQALAESEHRFRLLFEQSMDCLILHDSSGWIVDCNARTCESLGYSKEEMLTMNVRDYEMNVLSNEEKAQRERQGGTLWQRIMANEPGGVTGFDAGEHRRKDGATFPVETLVSSVTYGGEQLIFSSSRDVTERRRLEERLAYNASHDLLTGLPNRSLVLEHLASPRIHSRRTVDSITVLFVDLDNFKMLNDSLGHASGDRILVTAAERLQASLRTGDTAARLGGDEFLVILRGVSKIEEAVQVAERIEENFTTPFTVGDQEVFVHTSIGIASDLEQREEAAELIRKADVAMYRAKRAGKAQHKIFTPAMDRENQDRLKLETDLERGLQQDEFELYYQPKFSLADNRFVAFESLVRWKHPERGLLLPKEFLSTIEETGLIVPLGRELLQKVCQQAASWKSRFPGLQMPKFGVNISAKQLTQAGIVEDVQKTLGQSGLVPGDLILEVTEDALVEEDSYALRALRQLGDLGVKLAIDDFGTGYSSLSYLRRLPIDFLKIDRTFSQKLGDSEKDTSIVRAILDIAHALGIEVTAEGIETEHQLGLLYEMGCDFAQGYLLGRPMSTNDTSRYLERQL